jgi:DNA primase
MVGRITPELKERLLARTDIVDVVGRRVELKKKGKEHAACCPFHQEKTPSFYVSGEKQFYHCFGCGAHGNAIDFLIEYDRLSFPEAIEELAQQVGLELPEAGGPAAVTGPDPTPLLDLLERVAAIYQQQLKKHPDARRAIRYIEQRGLSAEVVERFSLGFAPPGWDFVLRGLGTTETARRHLVDAGLIIDRDGKLYDRFRNRLMFPIHDRRGRVVGFGGRVLGDGEPKYLNSPETPVFHKGAELYGLREAQQAMRRPPRLVVVEGYMDVIALAQFAIPYAVATLGTATTPEHVRRLLRSAPELVFCFDGDRAGRAAAWKALATCLPLATGRQPIRFLFLPDGEDPDTLVRGEGREAFERRLARATLLSDFLFEHLGNEVDLGSAEGRAKLDMEARTLIQTMPAGTFRSLLEQRLADLVGFGGPARAARPVPAGRAAPHGGSTRALTPQRLAVALLLDQPGLAQEAAQQPTAWQGLESPAVTLLREIIDIVLARPGISAAALCEHWRDTDWESTIRKLSDSRLLAHIPEEGRGAELTGALRAMGREAEKQQRWRMLRSARATRRGSPESGNSPSGAAEMD